MPTSVRKVISDAKMKDVALMIGCFLVVAANTFVFEKFSSIAKWGMLGTFHNQNAVKFGGTGNICSCSAK
jgi:hypothetical protein